MVEYLDSPEVFVNNFSFLNTKNQFFLSGRKTIHQESLTILPSVYISKHSNIIISTSIQNFNNSIK